MKKLLVLLLVAVMAFAVLTACNNTPSTPGNETENLETTKPENEEFVPEIIPASKVDPRQIVVDYMYKMANLEWTPSTDIDLSVIHEKLYYKKGVKYYGIMYCTGDRTMTDYDEFMAQLNDQNQYIGPITQKSAWGNHCSSAIRLSYDQIERNLKFGYTGAMVPSQNKGTIIVGDYKVEKEFTTTDEIVAINPLTVMQEAYAQLQKGDCILTCWGPTGHARMVLEVKVVRAAGGKLNPNRSSIITIEQTNSFDKQAKDGKNTTWYVEHEYTFTDLYTAKYIPLTIKTLQNTDHKDTEFTNKSLNTAENITEGKLKGIIRSSYLEIKSVTVDVLDSSNNVVATETYANTNNDPLAFQFNNRKAPEGITSLAAGDYTCLYTANTVYGSAKVAKLDFTVQ